MSLLQYNKFPDLRSENASHKNDPLYVARTQDSLLQLYSSIVQAYNYIAKLEAYCKLVDDSTAKKWLRRWIFIYNLMVMNYEDCNCDILAIVVSNKPGL